MLTIMSSGKPQVTYYVENITGIAVTSSCANYGELHCIPNDKSQHLRVEFVFISAADLKDFVGSAAWGLNQGKNQERPSYSNLLIVPCELCISELNILLPKS